MDRLKFLGTIGTIILVANIFLFAFRIITPLVFWIIIGVMAGLVYVGLPRWKKK
ncbi:MAG: hypothetical protein Q7K45_07590 [Nanoarchaeota archaeon]|nr:hypothetical protein [Nanoarchaeota archaeon]